MTQNHEPEDPIRIPGYTVTEQQGHVFARDRSGRTFLAVEDGCGWKLLPVWD